MEYFLLVILLIIHYVMIKLILFDIKNEIKWFNQRKNNYKELFKLSHKKLASLLKE